MLTYYAYRFASTAAPWMPRWLGYLLCDLLGAVAWACAGPARRAVQENLRRVCRKEPPSALVRQAFQSAARNYYETFVIPSLSDEAVKDWARVDGEEHLERALSQGKGAIMVGVHLGSPALAAQALALHGAPMLVVVEPIEPPELLSLISGLRASRGVEMIPMTSPEVGRALIRRLRSNGVLGLMLDRELTGNGAEVDFFGAPARVPLGPAILALATQAPILPSLTIRDPDGRVRGIIEPAIEFQPSGDRDADARALTRRILARLEYYIEQVPGQWTLFVPVWDRPLELPRC